MSRPARIAFLALALACAMSCRRRQQEPAFALAAARDLPAGTVLKVEDLVQVGIPAPELFIIMSHEIAYNIFQALKEQKQDLFIPILRETNPGRNFSWLCSFRMEGN